MKQMAWLSAGLFLLVTLLLAKYLMKFFAPFLVGGLVALAVHPLVDKLESLGINRSVASVCLISIILICLILIIGLAVSGLWQEISQLVEIIQLLAAGESPFAKLFSYSVRFLPKAVTDLIQMVNDRFSQLIFTAIADLARMISSLPNFVFHFFVTAITAFLLCRDKPLIISCLVTNTPQKYLVKIHRFKYELVQGLFAYLKIQILLMCVSTGLSLFCFSLIRLPYPWLIASIVGLLDLIPLVGPSWIFIFILVYFFYKQQFWQLCIIVLLWFLLALIKNFCESKIIGRQFGLHPLVNLLGIYLGVAVLGLTGFLLGPLLLVASKSFYNILFDLEL